MGDISVQVQKNITGPAKAYNDTHYYQSFEVDINGISNVVPSLDSPSVNAIGFITLSSGDTNHTLAMEQYGTELYDMKSGQYVMEHFFTNKLWEQLNYFNSNLSHYKITDGLQYSVYSINSKVDTTWDVNTVTHQVKNNVQPVVTGYSEDMSSFSSAVGSYNIANINYNFVVEWFGYFLPSQNGNYRFQMSTNGYGYIWVGNVALVDYNLKNATTSAQTVRMNQGIYYPVRIQFSMSTTTTIDNIQLALSIYLEGSLLSNGQGSLFSIQDAKNVPYEPIHLHYALVQPDQNAVDLGLYRLFYTKYNVSNNYTYNQQLRVVKSNPNLNNNYVNILQLDTNNVPTTLTLNPDGTVVLKNSTSSKTLTNLVSSFSACTNGVSFASTPVITLNGASLNQYYTIANASVTDPATGNTYTKYTFSNFNYTGTSSDPLYKTVTAALQNQTSLELVVVSTTPTDVTTLNQPLMNQIVVTNLNIVNQCTFQLNLGTDGNLVLKNNTTVIWSLFDDNQYSSVASNIKKNIGSVATANREWLDKYNAQVATMQLNLAYPTMDSQHPIYSSNGYCKLVILGNRLLLVTSTAVASHTPTSKTTNWVEQPHTYYLLSAVGEMKLGKTVLVDQESQLLQHVPVGGNILNYSNTFNAYNDNMYSFPPGYGQSVPLSNYITQKGVTNEQCQSLCENNAGCGHYYLYQDSKNSSTCQINTDNSPPQYLPKSNEALSSSTLYVRNKMITTKCSIDGYQPNYTTANGDAFSKLKAYSMAQGHYDPAPSQEGPCSVPSIYKSLNTFNGTETFVSRGGGGDRRSYVQRGGEIYRGESSWIGGGLAPLDARGDLDWFPPIQPVETMVSGYNPNICQTMQKTPCLQEIQQNIQALNDEYNSRANDSAQVMQKYDALNRDITGKLMAQYQSIHGNPQYDFIDKDGNLLYVKNNERTLLTGMIQDVKEKMMAENTKYIVLNIVAATILVGFFALTP